MAKKITGMIKLQIPAGKATPAPPVGPALGQHGVNIMDFCKAFNARTAKDQGILTPVVITVYQDHSYSFSVFDIYFLYRSLRPDLSPIAHLWRGICTAPSEAS